jgi:hypothetical protein
LISLQVKIKSTNQEMLLAACQMFMGKPEDEIMMIAGETLEGHQRAIMGNMTVEVSMVCFYEQLSTLINQVHDTFVWLPTCPLFFLVGSYWREGVYIKEHIS